MKALVKRVNVEVDPCLIAEAKKWNLNIENATLQHFKDVKDRFS